MRTIERQLARQPAVVLTGPRQVGKTTLAHEIARTRSSVYIDLESPQDLASIEDFTSFFEINKGRLIVLDEVQRKPDVFAEIRGLIDAERRAGRRQGLFLFLGSASLDLLRQTSETLAGRVAFSELFPVNVIEIAGQDGDETGGSLETLWLRGGFPESVLSSDDRDSLTWRQDFIRSYLERDIPMFGGRVPAETLRRLWTMLANNQGETLNIANLARALEIRSATVNRYIDLMTDLLLVRRLQPWAANAGKRLVKSPKVYVRDSGIAHALLGIGDWNSLLGHPVSGGSWEGFVIENLMSVAPPLTQSWFYRATGGSELDLILQPTPGEVWAIEIKRSAAPRVSRGFHVASEDVSATRKIVVYSGTRDYRMKEDIDVLSLRSAMEQLGGKGQS